MFYLWSKKKNQNPWKTLQSSVRFASDVLSGKNGSTGSIKSLTSDLTKNRKAKDSAEKSKKNQETSNDCCVNHGDVIHPSLAESTTSQLHLFLMPWVKPVWRRKVLRNTILCLCWPPQLLLNLRLALKILTTSILSIAFFMCVQATAAGVNLAEDAEIASECNFLHTLWMQVDVF